MCSPAPVVSQHVERVAGQRKPAALSPISLVRKYMALQRKVHDWMLGWRKTMIAELASLGQPKEGFHE